jgi:hypothetical protein
LKSGVIGGRTFCTRSKAAGWAGGMRPCLLTENIRPKSRTSYARRWEAPSLDELRRTCLDRSSTNDPSWHRINEDQLATASPSI